MINEDGETSTPIPDRDDEGVSLFRVAGTVLKYRYSVAASVLLGVLGLAATAMLTPRMYTSVAAFVPQGVERTSAGAAALADQLGLSLGSQSANESPQFYVELIQTREILTRVVRDTFQIATLGADAGGGIANGRLLDLLDLDAESEAERVEEGIEWLRERVAVEANQLTGIITVAVSSQWPALSQAIAQRLLALVNEFNRGTRRSQASAERAFIEGRLADAERGLRDAEDELKRFLTANRQFENSPELVFEHDRLQRVVGMRQQLFASLTQAYDDARIAEVRNTPVITVIEVPAMPVYPDRRGLILRCAIGLVLGGIVGMGVALTRGHVADNRERQDPDYRHLQQMWMEAVGDVRRLLRR